MASYGTPMSTGGSGSDIGAGYYVPGGRIPTSIQDALGQYASTPIRMTPALETSAGVFDGTSYVGEEAYTSEFTDMVTQPGKRLDQTAKPLSYSAKRDPSIGLSDQWVSGMPMFAISPAEIGEGNVLRIMNAKPQYRSVTMASIAQINKIMAEHYRRTRRLPLPNIHEDAIQPEKDKIAEHEKWKDTSRGHGKFLHSAGILLTKQDTSERETLVDVTKSGRVSVPNFWGDEVADTHSIGFVLKRMSTASESGPFQLVPWSSASNQSPTMRERRYVNILPNGDRQINHGTPYVVGQVLYSAKYAPRLKIDTRTSATKNLQLQMVGATTSIDAKVTPDGSDPATYAANMVKDCDSKIEIEPGVVPWMRAFS